MKKTKKSNSKKPSFKPDVIEEDLCKLFPKVPVTREDMTQKKGCVFIKLQGHAEGGIIPHRYSILNEVMRYFTPLFMIL